jgi:hypothetical protein
MNAKEVGMGNPAEETYHRPNGDTMASRLALVNVRMANF